MFDRETMPGRSEEYIPGERWKPVKGYEGRYLVSDMGRIIAMYKARGIADEIRFVKPIVQHSGYAHVGMCGEDGKMRQFRVHRLVAFAFCTGYGVNGRTQVNHINEDKLDNRAVNLEWATARENTNHGSAIARRLYGRQKAVECLDRETGEVVRWFISQADANAWCGVARNDGHIAACCHAKQKTAYGYRWRFAKKEVMSHGNECKINEAC